VGLEGNTSEQNKRPRGERVYKRSEEKGNFRGRGTGEWKIHLLDLAKHNINILEQFSYEIR